MTDSWREATIRRAQELAKRHNETLYVVWESGLHFDRETGECRGPYGIKDAEGVKGLAAPAEVVYTATP